MKFARRLASWRRAVLAEDFMGFSRDAEADRQGALVYLDRAERDLKREVQAHQETRRQLDQERADGRRLRERITSLEAQVRILQAQRPAP